MRGYQRKVIYLKNPGGEFFDEAYFVVRRDLPSGAPKDDMVFEANRIISENIGGKNSSARRYRILIGIGAFFSGAVISTIATALILLINN